MLCNAHNNGGVLMSSCHCINILISIESCSATLSTLLRFSMTVTCLRDDQAHVTIVRHWKVRPYISLLVVQDMWAVGVIAYKALLGERGVPSSAASTMASGVTQELHRSVMTF